MVVGALGGKTGGRRALKALPSCGGISLGVSRVASRSGGEAKWAELAAGATRGFEEDTSRLYTDWLYTGWLNTSWCPLRKSVSTGGHRVPPPQCHSTCVTAKLASSTQPARRSEGEANSASPASARRFWRKPDPNQANPKPSRMTTPERTK